MGDNGIYERNLVEKVSRGVEGVKLERKTLKIETKMETSCYDFSYLSSRVLSFVKGGVLRRKLDRKIAKDIRRSTREMIQEWRNAIFGRIRISPD